MSLYNQLFGVNPYCSVLLQMLRLKPGEIPRFRDCYLNKDGTEIVVYTRTGGANRTEYDQPNAAMRQARGFIGDADDSFDSTYAYFRFAVPQSFRATCVALLASGAHRDPAECWRRMLDKLETGAPDDPEVKRARDIGTQLLEQVEAGKRVIVIKESEPGS